MKIVRVALGHYRELILAGTFAAMATWEVLEMALLEPAPRASISLALVVHSLQIALILTATAIALRAWREKTARERALASLVEQVIVAQEEERRRVAYDVHDGVAQLIVSAKQHIDTAADLWTTDPGRAASETVIAADRLGRAITETRRILAALRPLAVDAAGLAEAARQSLDEVARDTGWSVALVENLGEANQLRANTHSFTATTSAGGTVQLSHETTALGRANRLVAGVDYTTAPRCARSRRRRATRSWSHSSGTIRIRSACTSRTLSTSRGTCCRRATASSSPPRSAGIGFDTTSMTEARRAIDPGLPA